MDKLVIAQIDSDMRNSFPPGNKENQITIIYDSMWNGTRVMAENIASGIKQSDQTTDVILRVSGEVQNQNSGI